MKLRVIPVLAALLLAAPLAAQKLTPIDEAGYKQLLAANRGKVLLVDFWATWCEPCRVEMPLLLKLQARHAARGLKLVTVSADEPETENHAVEFIKKLGIAAPAYIKRAKNDDAFINAIDSTWSGALPALFVYDRQGRKVKAFFGETGMDEVEKLLDTLLK